MIIKMNAIIKIMAMQNERVIFMNIIPHIVFKGNAKEAVMFYKEAFNAQEPYLMYWRDAEGMEVSDELKDKIMHGRLNVGQNTLTIEDSPDCNEVQVGNNFRILLEFNDGSEQTRVFNALKEGGVVNMPLQDTFWGATYGDIKDKFGISWSLNFQKQPLV